MKEVIAPEAVARWQSVCENKAAGEGASNTRPGLTAESNCQGVLIMTASPDNSPSKPEAVGEHAENGFEPIGAIAHRLVVLSYIEDGYSDGQISRITKTSIENVAVLREAFRRGGYV